MPDRSAAIIPIPPVTEKNRAHPQRQLKAGIKYVQTSDGVVAGCVRHGVGFPCGGADAGDQRWRAVLPDAPSIGLIFGSRQRMACRFQPSGPYPPEAYVGVMNTIGLDVGVTAGGVMGWGVFAPTAGPMYGGLAGTYGGASGSIGLGVGVGANLLFGGTGRSIVLQPLSVEGSVGVNLSVGVSALTLALAQ
jgi:hypothetical protein